MGARPDPSDLVDGPVVGRVGMVDDETLRLLTLVERSVEQRLDEALKAHGADIEQWRILSLLVAQGGCPMNVVAEHAMMLAPKLSKLVDRMVSANLVLRRPDELDRRRVLVVASPRGRQAHAVWEDATADVRRQFLQLLGPDAAVLDELLRRLRDGLQRPGTSTDR
ncbi:MarR family winged helix-turn-helix transcriptional regulator [Pseudonocardia sp. N23]|uniref:MarR family winged helix-turn-helix transcriptional regulator n=1 Tax=Pseudonocardia sp. N23 TaxID=1987376 RepID=UPI000BFDE012|nr:MarR family winged helix-turn-helix transcriptional regulator [Pseudonocardia sp. N23]GAY10425.1 transcriptional regulator, MarR family [Pseudonocardia sp. N23]